jgi:branched-chain amino acid transport system substrate-binding protein
VGAGLGDPGTDLDPSAGPAAADAAGSEAEPGPAGPVDGAPGEGALPCSAPSEAPGVDDDQLVVGSLSSLSGPAPGLGASAAAATRAYVAHRNASGGVCGRQIVLREADDGTDNGRYRSIVTELEPQVLGIVGGFAMGDVGGGDLIAGRELPVVGLPSSPLVENLPTVFGINPGFEDESVVIGKYRWLREQGASRVAMTYLAVEQSRTEARLQRRLMEAAGLEIVLVNELPLTTLSYDGPARRVANSGADYLFFIGELSANAAMARAMADTGHQLAFAEYFAFAYGSQFPQVAGLAAEGTLTWLRNLPTEEAAGNAEVARFVEWMGRIAPGELTDTFAADAWGASKAIFDALEALPGPISREALIQQLRSIETYDAGGMFAPIRFGAGYTNGCVMGMRVEGGAWRRMVPADGFLC